MAVTVHTPYAAIPYNGPDAARDLPAAFRQPLEPLEKMLVRRFADAAARDARFADPLVGAPILGMVVHLDAPAPGQLQRWNGTAWRRMIDEDSVPERARGVVPGGFANIKATLPATGHAVGEAVIHSQANLPLEVGRLYEATIVASAVDKDATGDTTVFDAKYAADLRLRFAAGGTVATTDTQFTRLRVSVFDDGSVRATGGNLTGWFSVTASGLYTVGVTLASTSSTGGVRLLGAEQFIVQDVGKA